MIQFIHSVLAGQLFDRDFIVFPCARNSALDDVGFDLRIHILLRDDLVAVGIDQAITPLECPTHAASH